MRLLVRHFLAHHLEDAGFVNTVLGYQMRRSKTMTLPSDRVAEIEDEDAPDIQETA